MIEELTKDKTLAFVFGFGLQLSSIIDMGITTGSNFSGYIDFAGDLIPNLLDTMFIIDYENYLFSNFGIGKDLFNSKLT